MQLSSIPRIAACSFRLLLFCSILSGASCQAPVSETASSTQETTSQKDSGASILQTQQAPELPPSVMFQHWEMGDVKNISIIWNLYQAWDSESPHDMTELLGDSTIFDWPNGTRVITKKETVEPVLRKWRNNFKVTSNTPVSIISLHNQSQDQDWVIAWVWNKWETAQGKKDSMLYIDNWKLENNKVVYLNSAENRTSKKLSVRLNKAVSAGN